LKEEDVKFQEVKMEINMNTMTDAEKQELLKKVFDTAVEYEKTYGCCAQCVVGAIRDVVGVKDDTLFKSVYGFGGGGGLSTLGNCGALSGVIALIGFMCGREYEDFDKGRIDKPYQLSKEAAEYFFEKYGGVRCIDVQASIMGESFELGKPEEYEKFLAAGGHEDKCPNVLGDAAAYFTNLILEGKSKWQEVYNPSRKTIVASTKNFVSENINVAGQLISGKLSSLPEEISIKPGKF